MKTKTTARHSQEIRKHQQKKFCTFCRIAEKSSDLSLTCETQPMIDERLMAARAIINTPREDREGDIIVPNGVHLENFRKNPVVLWEHGLGEITRPIAKCQHPDGNLALEVEQDQITATSYFTDKVLESLQIFHLISEGLVRATSVRAVPIKSSTRRTSNDGIGIVLEEWELIEWSWGALGVNPDAVARTIDRGTIEGHKISEPLLKSLKSILSPASLSIPGWNHSSKNLSVEISQTEPFNTADTAELENGQSKDKLRTEYSSQKKNNTNKNQIAHSNDDKNKVKAEEKSKQYFGSAHKQYGSIPLGAQILKSIHRTILELSTNVSAACVPLENECVKTGLNSFLSFLEKERINLKKSYSENYSYLKTSVESEERNQGLESANQVSPPSSNVWLQQDTKHQRQYSDYYRYLTKLAQAGNLTHHQHQLLTEFLKLFSPDPQTKNYRDENVLERNVEELSQAIGELQKKLCDVLPA